MNRREELLSINKKWTTDTLIKLLAYVYEIEDYEHTFFEELEIIETMYLDKKEE